MCAKHKVKRSVSSFTDRFLTDYSSAKETFWHTQKHQRHWQNVTWQQRPARDWCLRSLISLSLLLWLSHEVCLYHPPYCLEAAYGDAGPAQTGRATYCCHDTGSVKLSLKQQHNDTKTCLRGKKRKWKKTRSRLYFYPGCSVVLCVSRKPVVWNKITDRRRQTESNLWSARNVFEKHASCTFMVNQEHIR